MTDKKTKNILSAKEIAIIAIFAAITAVLAQIAVPLPFTPVPISFGLVAVYISAMLLKPKHAVLSQVVYLALGAVGVPVFGNFSGGLRVLIGPTGGYLSVYPIMAWIVSTVLNSPSALKAEQAQSKILLYLKTSVSIIIAHTLLYLGGTIWLSISTGNSFMASLGLAVFPFIPLDLVKIVFCIVAVTPLRGRMMNMNLLMLDSRDAV